MKVMPAVMGGPPERASLQGAGAKAGQHELESPTGLVGAVTEIAVEAGSDAEHPDEVEDGAETNRNRTDGGEENAQAGQVQSEKRHDLQPAR
jgi:hypothetical protein